MSLLGVPFTLRQAIATVILVPVALVTIWAGIWVYVATLSPA